MQGNDKLSRRETLAQMVALGSIAGFVPGMLQAATKPLALTRSQAEGPFYPVRKPAPASNDLIHAASGARAEGKPLQLSGRVFEKSGTPMAGAMVEIWQCDNRSIYRHPRAGGQGSQDPNFAGYGEILTAQDGTYEFLTIVPVAYPGRPPHIHAKIKLKGRELLTTQLYLPSHLENDADGLRSIVFFGKKGQLTMGMAEGQLSSGENGTVGRFDFVVEV